MFTSLVWLALSGLLQIFGFGLYTIPLAAWLVHLFMLRFSRGVKPLAGALSIWLTFFIANSIANTGSTHVMPYALYFSVIGLVSALFVLPYLADRLVAPRLSGFVSTLVFPVAWVTMELINSRLNPYGTWSSIAYTQYGNLPLMQLASVTGIAGITFLICWFGSVGNWAWESNFNWATVKRGVLIYAGVWSLVMLVGGARLAFAPSDVKAVRMATIGTPAIFTAEAEELAYRFLFDVKIPTKEREQVLQIFRAEQDWFLESAQREARARAKIVAWNETGLLVLDTDEEAFLKRAKEVAREEQVYLLMGVGAAHPGKWPAADNKTVLITPSGEVAFTYFKTRLVPGTDTSYAVPGDGQIPIADTPYGRFASVICYDMDFPDHVIQVGRAGVDVLFAPSADWQEVGPTHSLMAEFRAIENGVSLVRPARWGVHSAVDPYGRTLARMDEFTSEQLVMVAQVPINGVRTIYSYIGDLFAWLCVAGLLIAIAWAVRRSRQMR
jgi:apolipoprotein N-acyltransferase